MRGGGLTSDCGAADGPHDTMPHTCSPQPAHQSAPTSPERSTGVAMGSDQGRGDVLEGQRGGIEVCDRELCNAATRNLEGRHRFSVSV